MTWTANFGYRATFDVDRIWKGSVAKRFDVWVYELASSDFPRFESGRPYLVEAHRMTDPVHRRGAGLGDSDAVVFAPVQCSPSDSIDNEWGRKIVKDLGPGYSPR
jgi:hypothetical protein